MGRILMAGTHSGCGKTTLVCALLGALQQRGISLACFKCGPDYIDPMFHRKALGIPSYNLDLFLCSQQRVRQLLVHHSAGVQLAVMEGAMGYYDGVGGDTSQASAWHLAQVTESPAVLVVDGRGASRSVCAMVKGYLEWETESHIRGVILNRVSPMLYPRLKQMLEEHLPVQVLGYLPPMPDCTLESRHLGLVTAAETPRVQEILHKLAEQAQESIDLDALLQLAQVPPLSDALPELEKLPPVRLAVAMDEAFCFTYADNLELLTMLGAQLCPFSPLRDAHLPPGVDGLLLCGGYPELHLKELSQNTALLVEIRSAVANGMPTWAECGGFLYLTQELGGMPMAGVLPGRGWNTGKLARFGYVELTAQKDNVLCRQGQILRGHSFHYWDTDCNGEDFTAKKPRGGMMWKCIHAQGNLFAGFPHLHLWSEPELAQNFLKACWEYHHDIGTTVTNQ